MNDIARPIERIVVHTAAAQTNNRAVDQTAAAIRDYHVRHKGWANIGYHWVVRMDGRIEAGRPVEQVGAHVEGYNTGTIGICVTGHGDLQAFTNEQKWALADLCVKILVASDNLERFKKNPMRIIGHREINALIDADVIDAPRTTKSCPGRLVDMSDVRRSVLARIAELNL